jgi:hypothetical protein
VLALDGHIDVDIPRAFQAWRSVRLENACTQEQLQAVKAAAATVGHPFP